VAAAEKLTPLPALLTSRGGGGHLLSTTIVHLALTLFCSLFSLGRPLLWAFSPAFIS